MNEDLFNIDINEFSDFIGDAEIDNQSDVKDEVKDSEKDKKKSEEKENSSDKKEGLEIDQLKKIVESNTSEAYEDSDENGDANPESSINKKDIVDPNEDNVMAIFAKELYDSGVLSATDEEALENVKDVESLMSLIGNQIKSNEYSDLTEEQKLYLDSLRNGIPKEEFSQAMNIVDQYKSITEENIKENKQLQAQLIYNDFIAKGFSEDRAKKHAIAAVNLEDAHETAMMSKDSLIEYEENKLKSKIEIGKAETAKKLEEEKAELEKLKKKVLESKDDFIPGLEINSTTKNKIFESMTSPVNDKMENELMEQYAKDSEFKVKLHALFVLTKGLTDFSKITKTAKSKAVKTLDKVVKNTYIKSGKASPFSNKVNNVFGDMSDEEFLRRNGIT